MKQFGLIAEEVEQVMKELVIYKDGQQESVAYHNLNILLLNEIKKKFKENDITVDKLVKK
ncbi:MAG: hypothetical protein Edafosvirus15_21 [Edafosvirus sp.]|uniref:Uncharacterized protein n=1 Tax=Edafosvirus sp. TaxID=2487765 RepID=A0A3G4ZUC5_9VIRU|nr:MAG: hypothetical protein Edafosvirus15_21 [Edafosvirus sp.]